MDVFEAIYTRRSIRKFLAAPVEFDKVVEVTRAGSYAPCAGNLQNWRFIIETDPDAIKELYHHTLEQEAFLTATAAIIVVADMDISEKFYGLRGKRLYSVQNCAAAIQNMLLAAHALGLGAVWIGAFDENRVNEQYKIPHTSRAQAIVLLGYPDEEPQPRHMKNLWFLVNFHKYGLKYQHPHLITHDLSVEWERKGQEWKCSAEGIRQKVEQRLDGKKDDVKGGAGGEDRKAEPKRRDYIAEAKGHAQKILKGLKKEKRPKSRRR